jgi:HEPN domain-containing protein
MRRKRLEPDDPREWLSRARSNVARAVHDAGMAEVYLEDLCFDAQQSAEKAIKAVLILRGRAFPYTHDLIRLLTILEEAGERIPACVQHAGLLTRFSVQVRYPGVFEPVSKTIGRSATRGPCCAGRPPGSRSDPPPDEAHARQRRRAERAEAIREVILFPLQRPQAQPGDERPPERSGR